MSKIFEPVGYNQGSTQDGTRFAGGSASRTHSFVKGYFYVVFKLPSVKIFDKKYSAEDATSHLMANAISFQPHGDSQLMTAEEKGLGGTTANFITGIQTDTTFNLSFRERHDSPVVKALNLWAGYMSPYLGASCMADDFNGSEYKGSCMVIETKPVARGKGIECNTTEWKEKDITAVYLYDGVFPKMKISSAYDSSIEDNSLLQVSMPFSFDGHPLDIQVNGMAEKAKNILNNMEVFNKTSDVYRKLLDSADKMKV